MVAILKSDGGVVWRRQLGLAFEPRRSRVPGAGGEGEDDTVRGRRGLRLRGA